MRLLWLWGMLLAVIPVAWSAPVQIGLKSTDVAVSAARRHPDRVQVVKQEGFPEGAVTLAEGVAPLTETGDNRTADLTFEIRATKPGRYLISAITAVDDYGKSLIPKWKRTTLDFSVKMWFDEGRPTHRSAFSPWLKAEANRTALGRFHLTGKTQRLHLQLPRGVRLMRLIVAPYPVPAVPAAAMRYRPAIRPDMPHPRLWVNASVLPELRANLDKGEHRNLYQTLKKRALTPFRFDPAPAETVLPDAALEQAAVEKAFVYLMEKDRQTGQEAVALITRYLDRVEFGNMLDVAREIGAAVYATSLVYDWCYDLFTPAQRQSLCRRMLELASEMEVDWPPFRQVIVNGHGNEWQMTRDLLAMAIAVYDENPEPYRYLSYQVLEVLLPMRRFEYVSPRHNQGTNYGYLRYGCDLHAAWLMERMANRPVFDRNLFGVIDFWTYMRLPGNDMLPCGDGRIQGRYWCYPLTTMLAQAGSRSAQVKGEMVRQKSLEKFPMMALLFNDPEQKPDESFDTMPLTRDFGPVLGGMVARTGWDLSPESGDVIAEIRGGGYHFGNHQHADAGALQLYFRGHQIVDLGQYRFYGTPYDFGFNKRSVAHSMMLIRDPEETFENSSVNDGGIRFNQRLPLTPREVREKTYFQHGTVLSAAFGPDRMKPEYSYFSVDLTAAYAPKAKHYVRSFLFWNLGSAARPATVILLDRVQTARAQWRKFCQFNTAGPVATEGDGFRISNRNAGGEGVVHLLPVLPAAAERTVEILAGTDSMNVFGTRLTPPISDHWTTKGARVMISPRLASADDLFVHVLQMTEKDAVPLPVRSVREGDRLLLVVGDRAAILHGAGGLFRSGISWELPAEQASYRLTVTGLAPGRWQLVAGGEKQPPVVVEKGRNCAIFTVPAGAGRLEFVQGQ